MNKRQLTSLDNFLNEIYNKQQDVWEILDRAFEKTLSRTQLKQTDPDDSAQEEGEILAQFIQHVINTRQIVAKETKKMQKIVESVFEELNKR